MFHKGDGLLLALKEMTLRVTENLKNQANIYPTEKNNSKQIHRQLTLKKTDKNLAGAVNLYYHNHFIKAFEMF